MENKLRNIINKINHDQALLDLRLQNKYQSGKITYNSILYIDIIRSHENKYTASNIADMLHVSRPSVTQKINELQKMGIVNKTRSETDKRVYYLSVSDEQIPKELREQDEFAEEQVRAALREKYSEKDIDKFSDMLTILSEVYTNSYNK